MAWHSPASIEAVIATRAAQRRADAMSLLLARISRGRVVGGVHLVPFDVAIAVLVVARELLAHVRVGRGFTLRDLPVTVLVERLEGGALLRLRGRRRRIRRRRRL